MSPAQGDFLHHHPTAMHTRERVATSMRNARRLVSVARTDRTFSLQRGLWVGKCLICNGPIAFDAKTGEGGTLEHIVARTRGGNDDLLNLAVVHARCNAEKGMRWDPRRGRSEQEYAEYVARLSARRRTRFVPPESTGDSGDGR